MESMEPMILSILELSDVDELRKNAEDMGLAKVKLRNTEKKILITKLIRKMKERAESKEEIPMTGLEERILAAVVAKKTERSNFKVPPRQPSRKEIQNIKLKEDDEIKAAENAAKEKFQKRSFKEERNGFEFQTLRNIAIDLSICLTLDTKMPSQLKERLVKTLTTIKT